MSTKYIMLFLLSSLMLFSGCTTTSTLVVKPDILRFQTPETSGGFFHGSIDAHFTNSSPKYSYGESSTSDFLGNTSSANAFEKARHEDTGGIGGSLGIIDRVDFFARNNIAGFKYQFLGASQKQLEKGWKASVSIAVGDYSYVETKKDLGIFGSDDPTGLSSKGESTDFSMNTGYRYNKNMLSYIGIFKNKTDVTGTYETTAPSIASYTKKRSHHAEGIILGFNYIKSDNNTFITLEVGYTKSTWSTLGSQFYTPAGVSIGYLW